MRLVVKKENSGERLDKFLQEKLVDLSRSQIQKMIKAGEILVNDKVVAVHYFLKAGDGIQEYKNIKIQEYKKKGGKKIKIVLVGRIS